MVKSTSTTWTALQDVAAGVTVGSVTTTNGSFIVQLDNNITLNNGGAGATLVNNATVGAASLLTLGINSGTPAGGIILADNLSILNNFAGSTNASGSIKLNSIISGTGNVTISNVLNTVATGQIRLEAANTFTGTVTVAKGGVTFNKNTSLGNASNTVVLGSSGQGNVTLVTSAALGGSFAGSGGVNNNIVVAAGTGGTTVLGTISAAASSFTNFAGTVTLNGDLTTTSDQTVTGVGLFFSNAISGTGRLTVQGTGITSLTGTNTYTGDTRIAAGTLALGSGVPTSGGSTTLALQNSTLDMNGSDTGSLVFGTSTNSAIVNATVGGLKGSRNIVLANTNLTPGAVTLNIGNNNANTIYSGAMSGAGGIRKIGSGVLTLSGSNTFSGSSVVSAGTLIVNGSINNSTVAVSNGGTLGGSGRIAPASASGLTVSSGGAVAPGDASSLGTLEVNLGSTSGTVSFLSGAAFTFDLNAPGTSDVLSFTGVSAGDVAFNGNTVNFNNLGGLTAGTYTLFTFDAASGYTGTLNVGTGLGALSGSFIYNSNSIQLNVVPEPSTFAMLSVASGMVVVGLRRRLRRG